MARGRQTRRIPDRMSDLAITCVVLAGAGGRPAFLESIEYQTFSPRLRQFESPTPAQSLAIVSIEEESIPALGHWLRPSSRIAAAGRGGLGMAPLVGTGTVSPGAATPVGQRTVVSGDSAIQPFTA
jgi:hypothetical protein